MTTYKIEPVRHTPYMTVVEGRTPKQKVHTKLAYAKNAFDTPKLNDNAVEEKGGYKWMRHTHAWGAIFEFKDGDWVLIYEIPKPTKEHAYQGKYNTEYESRPWKLEN